MPETPNAPIRAAITKRGDLNLTTFSPGPKVQPTNPTCTRYASITTTSKRMAIGKSPATTIQAKPPGPARAASPLKHHTPIRPCPNQPGPTKTTDHHRSDDLYLAAFRPNRRPKNEGLAALAAASSAAVHVQRCSLGTPAITCLTCWPHPAQVIFLQFQHVLRVHIYFSSDNDF